MSSAGSPSATAIPSISGYSNVFSANHCWVCGVSSQATKAAALGLVAAGSVMPTPATFTSEPGSPSAVKEFCARIASAPTSAAFSYQ